MGQLHLRIRDLDAVIAVGEMSQLCVYDTEEILFFWLSLACGGDTARLITFFLFLFLRRSLNFFFLLYFEIQLLLMILIGGGALFCFLKLSGDNLEEISKFL